MNSHHNKLLISACLLGDAVRYDAQSKPIHSDIISTWQKSATLMKACPEMLGGLPAPRPAAEINAKLNGVYTLIGTDVSAAFEEGAQHTLSICLQHNIKIAVLTEASPSCGSNFIYDGSFTRKKIQGAGITTRLLRQHGIQVFNQFQLQEANLAFNSLPQYSPPN